MRCIVDRRVSYGALRSNPNNGSRSSSSSMTASTTWDRPGSRRHTDHIPAARAPATSTSGWSPTKTAWPRMDPESRHRTLKDRWIWLPDALGVEIRTVSNMGERARHSSLRLCIRTEPLVIRPSFRPMREATTGSRRVGEEDTGARKPVTVVVQQRVGQDGGNGELPDDAAEQPFSWTIPVTIALDEHLDILLPLDSVERISEPLPLNAHETLEAATTVEQRSVEAAAQARSALPRSYHTISLRPNTLARSREPGPSLARTDTKGSCPRNTSMVYARLKGVPSQHGRERASMSRSGSF